MTIATDTTTQNIQRLRTAGGYAKSPDAHTPWARVRKLETPSFWRAAWRRATVVGMAMPRPWTCWLLLSLEAAAGGCAVGPQPPQAELAALGQDAAPAAGASAAAWNAYSSVPSRAAHDDAEADAGSVDAASSIPEEPPAGTADLEALAEAYQASVVSECECFWADEAYTGQAGYQSAAECVATANDAALQHCQLRVWSTATRAVLACKRAAEIELQDCIDRRCADGALECLQQWSLADDACSPPLATTFYESCF